MSAFKFGKRLKIGHPWRTAALAVFLLAIALVVGLYAWYTTSLRPPQGVGGSDIATVTITEGMNETEVANLLETEGLIRSARAYGLYVRLHDKVGQTQSGTYKLARNLPVAEIVKRLTTGEVVVGLVTILPARSLAQIRQDFADHGYSQTEIDEALDPSSYTGHPALAGLPQGASLEGYLYPESFQVTSATKLQEVVSLSLDHMAEVLTPQLKTAFAQRGLSLHQAVTLASIVEREVSSKNPDDRPRVAQVFLSRLEQGMALQSNATDGYPVEYDTYSIQGLPPGPISNVSESSLQAVASPAETDFLYFVSGRDCVTRFSHTVAEHEALIGQYGVARPEDRCV